MSRAALTVIALFLAVTLTALAADPPTQSSEADRALQQFRVSAGLVGRVWATDPHLHNPVAFAFDERGICYVAETYRLHHGVTDNRNHTYWIDDDIAARTVEDRVAMYKKHAKDKFATTYEQHEDRVKKIWDANGDGRADQSSVFADGFKTAASGIGSGVFARQGTVYFTNIPDLWLLRDTTGDHKADVRDSLHYGYGVRVAFLGHDLHGLTMGPDGRLYFSVGDRGLNVVTKEGTRLVNPSNGAVLRCEPDGSKLEIVHRGLRNPQELAFDNYGNLFTVDNNSDSGDRARLVHITEGGDTGWRMHYQYGSSTSNRGPWNAEKLWHLAPDNTGAYLLPPLAHFTDGPSGLTFNPGGVALPEKYADHFFVCDFRGGADNSGVWAFTVKPKGASFELAKREQLIWRVLATDCDFAPDGGLYVLDWIQGWNQPGKGRIFRFAEPQADKKPIVAEVKRLFAEGFTQRSRDELMKLLVHGDRRVRQEAQFALAGKGAESLVPLAALAARQVQTPEERFARLHAIWALGQLGRAGVDVAGALQVAAGDHDSEIRAQAARMLGDMAAKPDLLAPMLKDAEPRVRQFAALALARSLSLKPPQPAAVPALRSAVLEMIRDNADQDRYVRHAGVMALASLHPEAMENIATASVAERLAVVLALRRQQQFDALVPFVTDPDAGIALEAVRGIHDESGTRPQALAAVAALIRSPQMSDSIRYRAMNAHFRLGAPVNAEALATLAATPGVPEALRIEAVAMLGAWARPTRRDRILGDWRPQPARDRTVAAAALRSRLGGIFAGPDALRKEAARVAASLGITEVAATLRRMVTDDQQSVAARVEALKALDSLKDRELDTLLATALKSDSPEVRAQALCIAALRRPETAVTTLKEVLERGEVVEKQAALATLADLKRPDADAVLREMLQRQAGGNVPVEIRLDLREAATRRNTPELLQGLTDLDKNRPADDPLWRFRDALAGGDAQRGRELFQQKADLTCVKCHKLNGVGGEVGPELAGIGKLQKPEYLLESLVLPDKQIAKGFDSVVLELSNGKTVTGVLKAEDATSIRVMNAEGQLITVSKGQVEDRRRGVSAMPDDLVKKMTPRELRDLVEFLKNLK